MNSPVRFLARVPNACLVAALLLLLGTAGPAAADRAPVSEAVPIVDISPGPVSAPIVLPAEYEAARQGTITGLVTDTESGAPVPDVQVNLEGTQYGALTNQSGRYMILNVPQGTYTVVAQMLGYSTRRQANVQVRSDEAVEVDFRLTITALRLEEIVVTGVTDPTAGVSVPFRVSSVRAEDLHVPQVEILGALRGRVSGARVRQADGEPGAEVNVLLRTPTSIARGNSPMIVVDGVILASGASMRDIDGFDIESLEVVKGAAASSLYGSRASNGVIQITTKRGTDLARGVQRFSLRSEMGFEEIPPDRAKMQIVTHAHPYLMDENTGDWLDRDGNVVDRANRVTNEFNIANTPYSRVINHVDQVFKRGMMQNHQLSMSQNTAQTRFHISATTHEQEGIVRLQDSYVRRGLRMNVDHDIAPNLSLGVSGFYSRTTRDLLPDPDPMYQIFFMPADVDLTAPDPEGVFKYNWMPDPNILQENPLYLLTYNDRTQNRTRFMSNVQTSYSPKEWLRLDGTLSYDRSEIAQIGYWPVGFKMTYHTTFETGQIERSATMREALNGALNVRFMHRFGDLTVRNNLRYLAEFDDYEYTYARGRELAARETRSLGIANERAISSSTTAVRSEGYYFTVGLDYANRMVGDFLVRQDGSSLFGPENRWNTYYRAAGAYRMAEERWWPFEFLTEFKLHASIGTAGGRPSFADRFETWGISGGRPVKSTLGNRALKPELATEKEFGVLMIARDRYSLQITRAQSVVEDQLLSIPLPGVVGYSSQWQNAGTLEGNTWEVELEASLINRPDLSLAVTLIGDRSRHVITKFDRMPYTSGGFRRAEGASLGSRWGAPRMRGHADLPAYHADSHGAWDVNDEGWLVPVGFGNTWKDGIAKKLWHTSVEIDGRSYTWGLPVPIRDDDGNNILEEIMNTEPDFSWAFSTNMRWRNFEFGGLVDAQVGGQIYNDQLGWAHRDGNAVTYDQRGKPEYAQKPLTYVAAVQFHSLLEDAGYVKLREISARYRFSQDLVSRILGNRQAAGLSVAVLARNLYTWTNYGGWDPEVGSTITTTEYAAYPGMRTISLSVQVDF
jgi:TonB-linked SusC/RagA family outer membrane protein